MKFVCFILLVYFQLDKLEKTLSFEVDYQLLSLKSFLFEFNVVTLRSHLLNTTQKIKRAVNCWKRAILRKYPHFEGTESVFGS